MLARGGLARSPAQLLSWGPSDVPPLSILVPGTTRQLRADSLQKLMLT